MLQTLKFVQGAVAKKDFVPSLTHFRIEGGFIKGYNGKIGLCSPIDMDLDVSPRAVPFIKAIQSCKETVTMHMTKAGRLAIKSGKFKAFVECIEDTEYPDIDPEGELIELNEGFLPAIKTIAPFISEDASRPWARGILFKEQSVYATNNIVVIEYWLGYDFPVEVNVPQEAIKELIRVNEEPSHLQVSANHITFHYPDGKWIKAQQLDLKWPDVSNILDRESDLMPFPEDFFDGVESLLPFLDEVGRVYMTTTVLSTSLEEGVGASQEVSGDLPELACFHGKQLLLLKGIAEAVDFNMYPTACLFQGDYLRGAIVGIRV